MIKLDINNPIVEDNGDVIIGKLTSGKNIIVDKEDYDVFMGEIDHEIRIYSALRLDAKVGHSYYNIDEYMENGKVDFNKYAEYVLARDIENLIHNISFKK